MIDQRDNATDNVHARPEAAMSTLVARPGVSVGPNTSLADAAATMRSAGVSALLVDGGAISTERDLTRALAAETPSTEPVAAIATLYRLVVPATTTVLAAAEILLDRGIRHFVVDDGRTLEVVSIRDVAAVLVRDAEHHETVRAVHALAPAPENRLG
jgi:CBS domain-containing protein